MSVSLSEHVPNRVLLIRLGAVRDGLMTVPLAVDAKRLWPQSKLSWVVDGEMEQILRSHSMIDEVIRIEPNWLRRPRTWLPLKQLLRDKKYDLVLDPQGVSKSAMLGWISGCTHRVGLDRPFSRELAQWLVKPKVRPVLRHRVDVYRELLSPWSEVTAGAGEFEIPSDPQVHSHVRQSIHNLIGPSKRWFAIYPGAIWKTAMWPIDRFATIAKQLQQNYNIPGLVVWNGNDEQLVAQVIAEQSEYAACVAPRFDLRELVELCRQAEFVLAGDSDLLQIASSVGTPTVSLHGPTWADEYGPYHYNQYAIQSPFPRLGNRSMRSGSNSSMQAIEVDEVMFYIQRLMRQIESTEHHSSAAA